MFVGIDDIKNSQNCCVTDERYYSYWTNQKEYNSFIGDICDIPQELLQRKFDKWDIIGNQIVFVLK